MNEIEKLKDVKLVARDGGMASRKLWFSVLIAVLTATLAWADLGTPGEAIPPMVYITLMGILMLYIGGNVAIKVVAKMYGIDIMEKIKNGTHAAVTETGSGQ